ncbi:hypothetical protein DRN69_06555 [Candidatus Pacearchaeota archaeon]|nr:MAG: hypothetical protein DRN69_06555 [Candidatus Pacearchaeota archaeon]
MEKKILLGPEYKKYEPPLGLDDETFIQREGIINPFVLQTKKGVILLSRLIYRDKKGLNSCIVKYTASFNNKKLVLDRINGEINEELIFAPGSPFGQRGVEDFRASFIEGEAPLHGFLVNYDGQNTRTEYLRTSKNNPLDLHSWEKFGVWFPNIKLNEALKLVQGQGDGRYFDRWTKEYNFGDKDQLYLGTKDSCVFPLKVNGKKAVIIRLLPDMQIIYVNDLIELAKHEFWQDTIKNLEDHILLKCENNWEQSHIGLAGPPFEIPEGVIIPYHGARMIPQRNYKFGIALVDKKNPKKVLARTKKPILEATEPWEENGVVSGKVVFPTGHAIYGSDIYLFYGSGDKYLAYSKMHKRDLLSSLQFYS